MEIKTFWTIVIKGIGLWLLMNCIYTIPLFASSFSFYERSVNLDALFLVCLIHFITIIAYILVIRVFLFKTNWLVKILKLDKNFPQDKIDLNISYRTVLSIVVIVIGALILADALPEFISGLYGYIKNEQLTTRSEDTLEPTMSKAEATWLIFYFLKTIFGYLIMTNSRWIVKFIDKEKLDIDKLS